MAKPEQPTVREAVAVFDDPEALKAAVSELQSHGFDRADISFLAHESVLPADMRRAADDPATPREPRPEADTDLRQERVLQTSLGAVIAAFLAAGFTVMTGGVTALAAGVAAVAAGGVGTAGTLLGRKARAGEDKFLQEQIERGGVLVWVRTRDAEAETRALDILRQHSGHEVHLHDVAAPAY